MAGVTKNLMVRAGADFSAITDQSKKALKSMRSMESSVGKSCSAMQKAVNGLKKAVTFTAIVYAARKVYGAAKEAAEAYDKQAEAEMKLARVMRNTMGARNDEIQSVLDLASAQQRLGVIGDEVQLAGAQELATYLSMSSTLQTLIPVMNDMAAQQYGYNVTAEETTAIATMLGKVMNGQVSALSRYGYSFDAAQEKILKYGNEEQRAAVLAQVVEQSVGGMNRTLAQTPTGRMKQLSNTLGDIKEKFGQAARTIGVLFIPLLNKVADILAAIATLANRVAQSFANVFGGKAAGSEWKYISGGAGDIAEDYDDVSTGIDDATGSMGTLADATEAAEEAVKNLRSTLDFDTLHVLSFPETDSGSTGSGTGSGGTGSAAGYTPAGIQGTQISGEEYELPEGIPWLENILQKMKDAADKVKSFKEQIAAYWEELQERLTVTFGIIAAVTAITALIGELMTLANIAAGVQLALDAFNLAGFLGSFAAAKGAVEALTLVLGAGGTAGLLGAFSAAAESAGLLTSALSGVAGLLGAFSGASTGAGLLSAALGGAGLGGLITSLLTGGSAAGGFAATLTGTMVPALGAGEAATGAAAAGATGLLGPIAAVIAIIAVLGIAIYECVKHWDEIKEAAGKAWDWIKQKWTGAGAWFQSNVWTPVKTFASNTWDNVQQTAGKAWDWVKQRWTSASAWFQSNVWTPVKTFASNAWDNVQQTAGKAWDWVKQKWTGAGAWFQSNVWTPVKTFASNAWDNVQQTAGKAWDWVKQRWTSASAWFQSNVWTPVKTFASNAWDNVQQTAGKAWDWIKQKWTGAGAWFQSNVWTPVKTFASNTWDNVQQTAGKAWDWVKQKWTGAGAWFQSNVWTPVKTFASNAWNTITGSANQSGTQTETRWTNTTNKLKELFDATSAAGSTAWGAVRSVGTSAGDTIKTAFSLAWAGIVSIWSGAASWFSGDNVFGGIAAAASDAVNSVVGFFADMGSTVSNIVSSAGGWLSDLVGRAWEAANTISSLNFHIPFLAEGAVIPPNHRFTAVLGDQRSGTNIETPERLLRQIMRQELAAVRIPGAGAGDTLSQALSDNSSGGMVLRALDEILDAVLAGHDIILDDASVGRSVRRIVREQNRIAGAARV